MGKRLLGTGIIVLCLLIASASAAEELIQNGGFETGVLSPWEEAGGHEAWSVTDSQAFEGAYSALVRGDYQLVQSFDPRPGSSIQAFTIAVMTAVPAWITVEVDYNDERGPTLAKVFVPAAFQWQALDLLEYIDPDRDVYKVTLAGHRNGDSPDDMRTWYDNVSLQDDSADEENKEAAEEVETIPAVTKRIRVKFNTRRPRTRLSLALRADELPEGIHEGPVKIKVLLSQDGFTTAFEAEAELVNVPHRRKHIIRLMDPGSADRAR